MSHRKKNQTLSHQQNIWIVTNYGEFKSLTTLRREFRKHFKSSPSASSELLTSLRTKIIEENIDTVRNLVQEKPSSSISEVSTAMNLSTVLCWRFSENIHINLKPFKVLLIITNCVEYKFFNWRGIWALTKILQEKIWAVIFLLRIMSNIRQYK